MPHVPEPRLDRLPARALGVLARDEPRQQEHGYDCTDVGERVAEVDPLQLDVLEQDACDAGPCDGAELRRDAVQRRRRDEIRLVDELRRHRALRAGADAERRGDD